MAEDKEQAEDSPKAPEGTQEAEQPTHQDPPWGIINEEISFYVDDDKHEHIGQVMLIRQESGVLWLTNFFVAKSIRHIKKDGMSLASALLDKVIKGYGHETIMLRTQGFADRLLSAFELAKLYNKFDFVYIFEAPGIMIRRPPREEHQE